MKDVATTLDGSTDVNYDIVGETSVSLTCVAIESKVSRPMTIPIAQELNNEGRFSTNFQFVGRYLHCLSESFHTIYHLRASVTDVKNQTTALELYHKIMLSYK